MDKQPEDQIEPLLDIKDRAFTFAVRIVRLCRYLEKNTDVGQVMVRQLLRAGTSVGANLEEAVAGESKADFLHKNGIALKEAREANYWLRLILATIQLEATVAEGVREMEMESLAIAKIIAKRIITTRKNAK